MFAMYHAPAAAQTRPLAVLFCAPFGWQDMGSYPIRHIWVQRLASAGHPVLRFDLPGTGQSAGGPGDPEQLRSWLQAIVETACWLRYASGSSRVAAIGLGLGALLTLHALAEDAAIDDLVLWGLPPSGRALTRSLLAFAKLQKTASENDGSVLPTGWLQSGGYVLSSETLSDLGALQPGETAVGRLRRALLLDQDGAAVDAALAQHLRQAGVDVQTAPGPGYAAMLHSPHSPQFSIVPDATIATVEAWLEPEQAATPPPNQTIPVTDDQLEIESDGTMVREHAFTIARSAGTMFGVLAEPAEPPSHPSDICLICLPTWAERCIGPNRQWVELARRHAARGIAVLRIDLQGIGDSDGVANAAKAPLSIFDRDRIAQIRRVMDALEETGHGPRFLLVGLCAGGYWAQQAAVDERVVGVLALNHAISSAGRELLHRDAVRRALLVFKPTWWTRVARGEASMAELRPAAGAVKRRVQATRRKAAGPSAPTRGGADDLTMRARPGQELPLSALLDRLDRRGARMTLGFSSGQLGYRELELEGIAPHPERWPALRIHRFESSDHNLRTSGDQRAIRALADELIEDRCE